jgi:hypothetical protein
LDNYCHVLFVISLLFISVLSARPTYANDVHQADHSRDVATPGSEIRDVKATETGGNARTRIQRRWCDGINADAHMQL